MESRRKRYRASEHLKHRHLIFTRPFLRCRICKNFCHRIIRLLSERRDEKIAQTPRQQREFQLSEQLHKPVGGEFFQLRFVQGDREIEITDQLRHALAEIGLLAVGFQLCPDSRTDIIEMRIDAVERLVILQQFCSGDGTDAVYAGKVVGRVARKSFVVDDLIGSHPILRLDFRWPQILGFQIAAMGDGDAGLIRRQLKRIAVTGDDGHPHILPLPFFAVGAEKIIRLIIGVRYLPEPERLGQLQNTGDLYVEVIRRLGTTVFVGLVLLMAECLIADIETDNEMIRLLDAQDVQQHRGDAEHRIHLLSGRRFQAPRNGPVGAIHQVMAIDENEVFHRRILPVCRRVFEAYTSVFFEENITNHILFSASPPAYQKCLFLAIITGYINIEMTPSSTSHSAIVRPYDASTLEYKVQNKVALQEELGWATEPKRAVVCLPMGVSDQLGGKLLEDIIPGLLELPVEILILGKGSASYGQMLTKLAKEHSHRIAIIPNDPAMLARMLAAADMALFLNKSSGTTELKEALSYGTVPVALADIGLQDYNPNQESGNAFVYQKENAWHCYGAVVRALETFKFPYDWKTIQKECMGK
jgi:hypothetical protein